MEELFRSFWPLVYRYMAQRLNDRELAADLASEVYVKAVRSFGSWKGEAAAGWLLAIARNVLIDYSRRKKFELVAVPRDLAGEGDSLRDADVRQSLTALSHRDRSLLELLHVHGFTVDEVAAMTQATPAAVRNAAYRARRAARDLLEDK